MNIIMNQTNDNKVLIVAPSGYGKTTAVLAKQFGSILDLDAFIEQNSDGDYSYDYRMIDYINRINDGTYVCCLTDPDMLSLFSKIVIFDDVDLELTKEMILNSCMRNYRKGMKLDYLYDYQPHVGLKLKEVIDEHYVPFKSSFLHNFDKSDLQFTIIKYYNKAAWQHGYEFVHEFDYFYDELTITDCHTYYWLKCQFGAYKVYHSTMTLTVCGRITFHGYELKCSKELKNLLSIYNVFNEHDLFTAKPTKIYSNVFIEALFSFKVMDEYKFVMRTLLRNIQNNGNYFNDATFNNY